MNFWCQIMLMLQVFKDYLLIKASCNVNVKKTSIDTCIMCLYFNFMKNFRCDLLQ